MDKEEEVPRPSEGQTSSANTDVERGLKDGKKESNVITALVAGVNELIKQKKLQDALEKCDEGLSQYSFNENLLEKKIKVLCLQGRIEDAYSEALVWLQREPRNLVAIKELKRLKVVLDAIKDQESDEEVASAAHTEAVAPQVSPAIPRDSPASSKLPKSIPGKPTKQAQAVDLSCSFCNMTFDSKTDLDTHCRSDEHKKNITSDEGHSWKYRPPPRGLIAEDYRLCERYTGNGRCPFADKCIEAHSAEELEEWRERFKFKRQQIQMAKDKHLHGNTYPEQLMEKLLTAEYPKSVMVANVDYAKVIVNSDLKVNMISKKCTHAWTFTITSKICILRVVLLDEAVSNYFYISSISVGPKKTQKYQTLESQCQEWKNPDITINRPGEYVYRVKVVFKTDIYGAFRQTLVFDFGSEPVLSRDMHVESAPVTDTEKVLSEIRLSQQGRWLADQIQVVEYKQKTPDDQKSLELLKKYSLPEMSKFRFSEHLMHTPTKENYRLWMHQMLYVEELAQIDKISKFNITTTLQLVNRFLLMPGSLSAAKFAQDGELFARMKLEDDLSVDSVAGRLILKSTNLVWLAPYKVGSKNNALPKKVYEAVIEDRGKNFIFLRLSRECVEELELTCDQEFSVEVQFQLNRLHLCEMHHAVDALTTLDIVFPDPDLLVKLPDLDDWDWKEDAGDRTNENQKDAIMKCAAYSHMPVPPLLIVGPFGTGKTYTLAQCAKHVLLEPNTRILICTHSNSAADIYIKEFLHPYVMEGNTEARPLRVYYRHRWIQTVSETVLQYCIQEQSGHQAGTFRAPEVEDVEKHRVVVTTLSTARLLSDLELPDGFFTHIFLDEAAQALECDMLIPLSLAGNKTRVVLAGDHMQMSPEAFSDFAHQQQFHKSLLERLYDMYPDDSPCKVMLCENYRANRAIIEFTSELFYDNKLKASKDPVAHSVYYPLTFFTARGEEVQHENSSGYYNTSEIYEVIEQVEHLQKHWPPEWGDFDENSICVVAPYSDQVMHIRSELRKRKMYKVSVERVVNVQGRQFRVIVMSTVRTRHTCSTDAVATDKLDLGFLSNIKLLNTAITRAQSLVIAVGDPVSLCLAGRCSKVWEYYLEVCNDNNSFFGMTWPHLRSLLNNAEMTKTYILNPLAPEFIPKTVYSGAQGQHVYMPNQGGTHPAAIPPTWPQGYRGPHPQVYYGNPYMQMMYPPNMYIHPYYGPVMYRPHPGMYPPGMVGKLPQSKPGMQKHTAGYKPKAGTQHQGLPVQRDDDDERSTESPKQDKPSPHATPPKQHMTPPSRTLKKQGQGGKMLVNVMPRMPIYPSYYPAYSPYMLPPEDPRYMGLGIPPQPPYYYTYGNMPRAPFPAMVPHAVPMQMQPKPGSGSVSPASSSEGASRSTNPSSPTGGSQGETQAVSPGSAAAYQNHQHFQVLPNVKHVPSHLLYNPPGSGNNSRSSTPVMANSPVPTQPGSRDSPRNSQGELDFPAYTRRRQHSGPRPVSQSPSYSSQSSHESSTSPVLNGDQAALAQKTAMKQMEALKEKQPKITSKMPRQLKLNTHATGFSRQFSDELGTPTEITNLVKMLDENIEERDEDQEAAAMASMVYSKESIQRGKPSPPAGKLFLNLPIRHGSGDGPTSSGSSSQDEDTRTGFQGSLPRHQLPSYREMDFDTSMLEPQTPMTPAGFHTPGTDLNTDPLEILRNLTINNDNLNRSTHGHFQ